MLPLLFFVFCCTLLPSIEQPRSKPSALFSFGGAKKYGVSSSACWNEISAPQMSARGVFGLAQLTDGNDTVGSFSKQKSVFRESLHPNAGRSLSKVDKVPVNNFERNNKANMTTRKQEFRSILRVLEIGHIVKVPLACLLVVGALFTNKPLDFNSEVKSRFCFFRRERRRRLLRSPLDFFLNKVAVSFDIGVRCFFRREYRRRLW